MTPGSIGIFDSGVGGLSILAEVRALLPSADIVYAADQMHAPYGERELAVVRERALAVTRYLIDVGATAIVVACNSASAAALVELRDRFPGIPFVGMEPAVKPAAGMTQRGTIGVLATEATFQGELFASVVDRHARDVAVVARACPGLAAAIEDGANPEGLINRYTTDIVSRGADTIVLGCTHYSFVADRIRVAAGASIRVIDPVPAVARQVARVRNGVDEGGSGSTQYVTTGDAERFAAQMERFTGSPQHAATVRIDDAPDAWINVVQGDITNQEVDVVVNAANAHLRHGGGVAAAISRAGGPAIDAESQAWIDNHGPVPRGGAVVTSAGRLPAGHVVHVVGPVYHADQDNQGLLKEAVRAALDASVAVGARSVAMPAISAGIFGYPPRDACAVIADAVAEWQSESGLALRVVLVAFDEVIAGYFRAALKSRARNAALTSDL